MLGFLGEILAEVAIEASEEASLNRKLKPAIRRVFVIVDSIFYLGVGSFIIFGAWEMKVEAQAAWIKWLIMLAGGLLIGRGAYLLRRQAKSQPQNNILPPTDPPQQ